MFLEKEWDNIVKQIYKKREEDYAKWLDSKSRIVMYISTTSIIESLNRNNVIRIIDAICAVAFELQNNLQELK